jgi:hypothetical protein
MRTGGRMGVQTDRHDEAYSHFSDVPKNQSVLFKRVIFVCSESRKQTNLLCGQNVEFIRVKPGGTFGNQRALKG